MSMIKEALLLSKEVITCPARAFKRICASPHGLYPAALVYFFFTVCHSLFYALKPADFPAEAGQVLNEVISPWAWMRTELFWGTVFMLAWIFFLASFLEILRRGRLPLRIIAALSAAALPGILIALQAKKNASFPVVLLSWSLLLAFFSFFSWRLRGEWKPLASLFLSLNAIALLILPAQAAAAAVRWENAYIAVQFAGAVWMLAVSATGIRAFTGSGIARNVLALSLALILNMGLVYSLHLAEIVPARALKVLIAP